MSGSQSYDPFAYGSVRLDQDAAGKAASGNSPEDLLFTEAAVPGPGNRFEPQRAGEVDTSWEPMHDDANADGGAPRLDATDFGADILGEAPAAVPTPARAAPARPPAAPRPAAAGPRPPAANWTDAVSGSNTRPAPNAVVTPAKGLRPLQPPRPGRSLLSVMLSTAVVAAGGAGAAWLHLIGKNPVMAALTGATGLVLGAFAWISTRR